MIMKEKIRFEKKSFLIAGWSYFGGGRKERFYCRIHVCLNYYWIIVYKKARFHCNIFIISEILDRHYGACLLCGLQGVLF